MKRNCILAVLSVCVLACPLRTTQPAAAGALDTASSTSGVLHFLEQLQDSQDSGLAPLFEGSDATTTYSNALAAIAFVAEGETGRARAASSMSSPDRPMPARPARVRAPTSSTVSLRPATRTQPPTPMTFGSAIMPGCWPR